MIHVHTRDGHEWLTEEEFKLKHPALYAAVNAPRPFNEAGEIIRKARQRADMTVRELAKATGIPLGELSAIETGRQEATQEQVDAIGLAIHRGRS